MNNYIIKTFASQRNKNIDNAINFYEQKVNALINSMDTSAKQEFSKAVNGIDNINEILQSIVEKIDLSELEDFYNQKISGVDIQQRVKEYNVAVQAIEDGLKNGFDTLQFLNYLKTGSLQNNNNQTSLPQFIDLSSEKKALTKLSKGGYATASAAGGARARVIGELVEQILLQMTQDELKKLFKTIVQAGSVRTKNFSGTRATKGKSDLLFSTGEFEFVDFKESKTTGGKIGEQIITLDLAEAVDLENVDINNLISKYTSGAQGQIGGMTIKQWTDNVLGSTAATIAHSTYTKNLINNRYPNGQISEFFENKEDFKLYTAYVVSRYLINIIGVYNVLVSNTSGVETTAAWLNRLKKNGYALQHYFSIINSIPTVVNDTVYVGTV